MDVAPPGEGTMESAPRVFLDVNIDVGLRDPSRQGRRVGHEGGLPRDHRGRKPSNARGRWPVARQRVELVTEGETQVAPEPCLRRGILEEELVEHRILVPWHERRRWPRVAKPPRAERRAERDNSAGTGGAQKRRFPSYRAARVVACDPR